MSATNEVYERLARKAEEDLRSELQLAASRFRKDIGLSGVVHEVELIIDESSVTKTEDGRVRVLVLDSLFCESLVKSLLAQRLERRIKREVENFMSAVSKQQDIINGVLEYMRN